MVQARFDDIVRGLPVGAAEVSGHVPDDLQPSRGGRRTRRREKLVGKLHEALDAGGIEVALQRQVRLGSGEHAGFEALVRWQPGRAPVAPPELIAIAEAEGLVVPLGRAIMDRAFAAIARLRAEGLATGRVAINVTAAQLLDPGFPGDARRLLQRHGLGAGDLEIEVTESVILDRSAGRIGPVLQALRGAGMTIALDDFGTGYASLLHLKQLPVDRIKIDRSFIAGLPGRGEDLAIARAIISLAQALGCETVAEGVETAEQMQALAGLGCDSVQGFYVGRPLSVGRFRKVAI